jgi:hypothetical protein
MHSFYVFEVNILIDFSNILHTRCTWNLNPSVDGFGAFSLNTKLLSSIR